MSSYLINGAKYALSRALSAAVATTAVSNADPAVATTATPPADGAIVVINSGWSELNDIVARADSPTATAFNIEGYDTTSTTRFPAGEGVGSYRVASDFIGLDQVRDITFEGGEQQFFTYQYVEDASGRQRRRPTVKSPSGFNIMLDYDPARPWFAELIEMDRNREPVVMRELLPNGAVLYHYGYVSFNREPTRTVNENMTCMATFSPICDSVRYEAA